MVWRRTIGRVLRGLERQSRLTLALLSRVNPNFRFWPVAVVLVGCCENSQEEAELEAIADAMDAYDTMARLWGRQALKLAGSDDTGLPCMQLLAFGFGQLR